MNMKTVERRTFVLSIHNRETNRKSSGHYYYIIITITITIIMDSNSSNSNNNNEWKVVTAADKKRVMRKQKRSSRLKYNNTAVAHPTAESQTAIMNDDDHHNLSWILSSCRTQLQSTDFYQQLLNGLLLTSSSLSKRRRQRSSCTASCTSEEKEDEEEEEDEEESSLMVGCEIDCILCLGVGNFSKTSMHHYSPSLWQMACALQLRDDLQQKKLQLYLQFPEKKTSDDNDEETQQRRSIEIWYYDIVSTSVEEDFLRKEHGVHIIPTNQQGKHCIIKIRQQTSSTSSSSTSSSSSTLCFMPHCPLFLYENMVAENWNQLDRVIIVGNSIHNHLSALQQQQHQVVAQDTPRLKEVVPWIVETLLDATFGMTKSSEKNKTRKTPPSPAEFVRAFNDTYLTYFNVPILKNE